MTDLSLKNIHIFKNCDEAFLSKLNSHAQIQTHAKGKILFLHEDEAERFYIIRKGWVKLFRETIDGSQAVIDMVTSGHIIGETAIFEQHTYPYSAEVVEKAEIVSLPLSDLQNEIETNHNMTRNMLEAMAMRRQQQDREIEHRSLQNAAQRIGCFLLRLTEIGAKGAIKVQLPYDKVLVASRLGMQPETFSRALTKLKEKTGIRVHGSCIEVDDIQNIVEYSCAACSSEFPCKDIQMQRGEL